MPQGVPASGGGVTPNQAGRNDVDTRTLSSAAGGQPMMNGTNTVHKDEVKRQAATA